MSETSHQYATRITIREDQLSQVLAEAVAIISELVREVQVAGYPIRLKPRVLSFPARAGSIIDGTFDAS